MQSVSKQPENVRFRQIDVPLFGATNMVKKARIGNLSPAPQHELFGVRRTRLGRVAVGAGAPDIEPPAYDVVEVQDVLEAITRVLDDNELHGLGHVAGEGADVVCVDGR